MLESIQRQFCQNLFTNEPNLDFISSLDQAERFAVYQITIKENLRHALELTFPGIWALLGCDCANGVAHLFIKQVENFPRTGCLDDWGQQFPAFLATVAELKSLVYLKDFAWFEWLKHMAYGARDEPVLKANDLHDMADAITDISHIIFHSSVSFFSSAYPINQIQELIKNPEQTEVCLEEGECYALILRENYCVTTYWLQKQDWEFLYALRQRQNLEEAYEKIIEIYSDFDLVKNLHFMIKNGIIHQVKGS